MFGDKFIEIDENTKLVDPVIMKDEGIIATISIK
jgi:cGMP-dependent protein kinase